MSGDPLPLHQRIGQVFARDGSHAFVGSFNNCHFLRIEGSTTFAANEQDVRACRNALYLTDPYIDRANIISAKGEETPGTCKWITQDESYRSWLHGSTRLLWISGGPGKGKTMLSVFLTKELGSIAQVGDSRLIFYFCSYQDDKRNTGVAVLRGLVHQILTKRPQLTKHALPYFESPERTQQSLLSLETLWIIFIKILEDPELGTMFCILDGLDECDQDTLRLLPPKLVNHFSSTNSSSSTLTFKLAIVSRDITSLRKCVRVRLDANNDENVARDVERFISTRVHELSSIEGFNDEMHVMVKETLLNRCEGTFLWVGFAMTELLRKRTCIQVLESLDDLPTGLTAIYGRMLLQIPDNERQTSAEILRWVTVALRPLLLQELAAALQIQPSSSPITVDRAIRDRITLLGPFLKIQGQEVSLIHQSARDYLMRQEPDGNPVLEEFRLEPEKTHFKLARTCLECLSHSRLQHSPIDLKNAPYSQESPLLPYAVLHWQIHARDCLAFAAGLLDLFQTLCHEDSPVLQHWWETYRKTRWTYPTPNLPLHTASYLGTVPWVQVLLMRQPQLVNEKDKNNRTALGWAAERGHQQIVQVLINAGANMNAKDEEGDTALHTAMFGKFKEIAILLIGSGADTNATNIYGATPFHYAAVNLLKELGQRLVDSGANVNATLCTGETALHDVAFWGHGEMRDRVEILQLLIDNGVEINAVDDRGDTALHTAASYGHHYVVQFLVDNGADVRARNKDRRTVLHNSVERGDRKIVQILLDNGADVGVRDKWEKTALQIAADKGYAQIIQLLNPYSF